MFDNCMSRFSGIMLKTGPFYKLGPFAFINHHLIPSHPFLFGFIGGDSFCDSIAEIIFISFQQHQKVLAEISNKAKSRIDYILIIRNFFALLTNLKIRPYL